MKRYFEFSGADSSRASGQAEKFWEISHSTTDITVRFGKIGANGQTTSKSFPDAATALREVEKLIAEKLKKGYLEKGSGVKPKASSDVTTNKPKSETKECIACAEDIKQNAKLCKHCGTSQDDSKFMAPKVTSEFSAKGTQLLDERIEAIFACAIDFSSWDMHGDGEEEESLSYVYQRFSLGAKTVEKIRSWWFRGENNFLEELKSALLAFSVAHGCDSKEVEFVELQFESDIFCADLIMFLSQHFFGEPPLDDDVHFAEVIEVEDVDVEGLNPHFAQFLKSSDAHNVTVKFFDSTAGTKVLELVKP